MYSLKKARSDWRRPTALGILFFGLLAAFAGAAELKPDTIEAFDRYVTITEEERATTTRKSGTFLWIDSQEEALRKQLHDRLARGEVVIKRLETRDDNRPIRILALSSVLLVGKVFRTFYFTLSPTFRACTSWRDKREAF